MNPEHKPGSGRTCLGHESYACASFYLGEHL